MRVHVGEGDRWHGKLLYLAIIELLRQEGLFGATVLRGCGGYGSSSRYHTDNPPLVAGPPDYHRNCRVRGANRKDPAEAGRDGGWRLITLEKPT